MEQNLYQDVVFTEESIVTKLNINFKLFFKEN